MSDDYLKLDLDLVLRTSVIHIFAKPPTRTTISMLLNTRQRQIQIAVLSTNYVGIILRLRARPYCSCMYNSVCMYVYACASSLKLYFPDPQHPAYTHRAPPLSKRVSMAVSYPFIINQASRHRAGCSSTTILTTTLASPKESTCLPALHCSFRLGPFLASHRCRPRAALSTRFSSRPTITAPSSSSPRSSASSSPSWPLSPG